MSRKSKTEDVKTSGYFVFCQKQVNPGFDSGFQTQYECNENVALPAPTVHNCNLSPTDDNGQHASGTGRLPNWVALLDAHAKLSVDHGCDVVAPRT